MVRDGSGVTYGNNWQFPHDTLNGNDIENGFPIVKLVYHQRANGFQPAYQKVFSIMPIIAIIDIIVSTIEIIYIISIICIIHILFIFRIIVTVCFQGL